MADKYISLEEALRFLGIQEDKFETLISNGEIKAFRTQGKVKFREGDVNELASRLESINVESVVDDEELPSLNDSSEVMPAVEMETLEDSDFTIELPDEVVSGDPTASSSGLSLEEEDSLVLNVDDFGLEDDSNVGADTNPSDITIHEEELDLNVEDDSIATSDITIQDETYGTSELTVQEDAVNTSELTVQEDAVNTSEMTVDDGYGTEAGLVNADEIEESSDESSSQKGSRRTSGRRSSSRTPVAETTSYYMLFVIFSALTLVVYVWSLLYTLPYHYYKNNNPLTTKTVIPDYVVGQRDWMKDQIISNNKDDRSVDAPFKKETFSNVETKAEQAPTQQDTGEAPVESGK